MSRLFAALPALAPLVAMQAVGVACGIAGVRWSSGVVPPELLGVYGVLLTILQLAPVITHHGLLKDVQRHWSAAVQPRAFARELLRGSRPATLLLTAAVVLVAAALHVTGGTPFSAAILAWAAAANLLAVVGLAAQSALQAEGRGWGAFAVSAVGSVTRSFLPPLLVTLAGASLVWLNTGFLLHVALQAGVAAVLFAPVWSRPGQVPQDAAAGLRATLRAFAGVGACGWLAAAAPRWLAAVSLDEARTGYFVLASNLSVVVPAVIGGIAVNFSFPRLFSAARAGVDARLLVRATQRTVVVVMLGAQAGLVALHALAPALVGPVIHPRYVDALEWILPTGGAALAATTTQFYHNLLLARGREADCLKLSLYAGALRLALLGATAAAGAAAFRSGLLFAPWVAVGFEAWYAGRRAGPAAPVR